jgi:hypothetical protein
MAAKLAERGAEKVVEFTKSGGNAIFSAKTHIPRGGSHISAV